MRFLSSALQGPAPPDTKQERMILSLSAQLIQPKGVMGTGGRLDEHLLEDLNGKAVEAGAAVRL